ncbi:FAD-binding protein [Subtercola vilae]|uniref:FAD-binding protein n=1 Tax=Subtercola vilae TaxID=2056433 RepID=A0A4T2BU60_9MICO|nr:FAD-binding protein [Subtercola vilae]
MVSGVTPTEPAAWLAELTAGVATWSTTDEHTAAAGADRSGTRQAGLPSVVVYAHTVADVVHTLTVAHRHRVPVVTRGAGSGLAGGATAGSTAIVLDLASMNRIVEISPVDGLARVEPGVITADLDRAAAGHGLFYAPDPGSVAISTIGGNIATNAGGLRGAKYGVTRDAVLALDVVLADGTVVHTGRDTVKGVTGYDLTALFVGSEGTLGVVVGATVRLLPRPKGQATAAAYFSSVDAAARASVLLATLGVRPAVVELVDGRTLAAIDDLRGTDHATRGAAFLLVQTDGFGAIAEIEVVAESLRQSALSVEVSADAALALALAAARRDALPAIEARGRVLIEDIAVPRSRLAEAFEAVTEISERTGIEIYQFAHAGDGNLHPIIVIPPGFAATEIPAHVQAAADEIFALALRLGGTLTAEHGIGRLKAAWVEREVGPEAHRLMRGIRALFDPRGILNPGTSV